jgi:hypothetical protein
MIKLAQTETEVYIKLSKPEFKLLAKVNSTSVPEGSDVSLAWILNLNQFTTSNSSALINAKAQVDALSLSLESLITSAGS